MIIRESGHQIPLEDLFQSLCELLQQYITLMESVSIIVVFKILHVQIQKRTGFLLFKSMCHSSLGMLAKITHIMDLGQFILSGYLAEMFIHFLHRLGLMRLGKSLVIKRNRHHETTDPHGEQIHLGSLRGRLSLIDEQIKTSEGSHG